jgi:hypothetical protein
VKKFYSFILLFSLASIVIFSFSNILKQTSDYESYNYIYETTPISNPLEEDFFDDIYGGELEIGFIAIIILSKFIGLNFSSFYFLLLIIILTSTLFTFRSVLSGYYFAPTIFFISWTMLIYANTLRLGLAATLLFLFIKFLYQKRWIYYLIVIIIASQIHVAAFFSIFLIIILIIDLKITSFKYIIFLSSIFFGIYGGLSKDLIFFVADMMSWHNYLYLKFDSYINRGDEAYNFLSGSGFRNFFITIISIYLNFKNPSNYYIRIFTIINILSLFMINFFADFQIIGSYIFNMYLNSYSIILGFLIISLNKRIRFIGEILMISILIIQFLFLLKKI